MATSRKSQELELVPDAWPRFERFISQIAKAGPQHRKGKPKSESVKSPKKRKAVKNAARE